MSNRMLREIFAVVFLLVALSCCRKSLQNQNSGVYSSYINIPGVTENEINAIEALREKTDFFVYGMLSSTEAFMRENGEIGGFTALFCEWLSQLFGIPFKPAIYEWGDMMTGMDTGKIDFTGEMTATDERRKNYFMSDAIAERWVKTFRLADSKPITEIIRLRPLRCCFLEGVTTINDVTSHLQGKYEIILVNTYNAAYQALKNEEADAFFLENSMESYYDVYGDVLSEDFLPVIYSSVSLTTKNQTLGPIISVVQKALRNGGINYLTNLYSVGNDEYRQHKLLMRLSEKEKMYIKNNPVIPFASEYDNYPVSFYNKHDKEWQGIAHDVVSELEALTGLTFKITNDKNTEWLTLLNSLERREVRMISELLRTTERTGLFLWPQTAIMTDNYALISKMDYPNIHVNDILRIKVGLIKDTAYASVFLNWFPDNKNIIEYENTNAAFDALKRGKVDMVMANVSQFLMLTNFFEQAGYKANIVFDYPFESTFGFNKNEIILCSIVDKALALVDTKGISEQWMRKTYDYSVKLAHLQHLWLISAAALLFCVLAFLFFRFQKNRRTGYLLEKLVQRRTNELTTQNATVAAMFDATPDLVFCKDLNSRFIRCNKTFENYFNIRETDIIGKGDVDGLGIPADLAEQYKQRDRKVVEEGHLSMSEELIPSADGTVQLFETSKVPLVQNGRTTGLLVISHNITERKAMEEQALSANRAKTTFLANMSHEIRTPLNAVIGMITIGKSSAELARKDYCFTKIEEASHHLLGVINDILDMSKIEANKFELSPVEFDFEKMLQGVVNVVNFRVDEKRQKLSVHIDSAIPRALVADDQRLAQVITNLLGNSVKFTPENGSISLETRFLREEDGICTIEMSVSDTGIGISAEQQKHLFNSFQQAEADTTRRFGGSGLGLAISKNIVEMMGGIINVKSEAGKGSVFTFTIKARKGAMKKVEQKEQEDKQDFTGLFAGKHILLAEDVEINREIVMALLEPTQIEIDCAENGIETVRKFNEAPDKYDLIFMDVQMPEMDGYEATQRIRAIEAELRNKKNVNADFTESKTQSGNKNLHRQIPIIAMTANVFKEDIKKCLDAGMDGHVGKPLNFEEVISRLNFYLK